MFKAGGGQHWNNGHPPQKGSLQEWQLCAIYAGLLPAWTHSTSWITVLVVKPNVTGNTQNRRDRKRQRNHTRRSPSLGDERRCPNYSTQRSPKDHKSGILLNTFCPVQPENVSWCPFWIFLASFLGWVLTQLDNCHFFLQPQCVWSNGAYINNSIWCFNFNMLNKKHSMNP